MTLNATTSQTVGPYYHIGLTWLNREDLTVEQTLGERVAITGQVIDGNSDVVNDAMLEVWQANAAGKYDHPEDDQDKPLDPNFEGFGRVLLLAAVNACKNSNRDCWCCNSAAPPEPSRPLASRRCRLPKRWLKN